MATERVADGASPRKRMTAAAASVLAAISLLAGVAAADSALVRAGGELGQALLFHHRDACFALTAHHVVAGKDFIELLPSESGDRVAGAELFREMPGDLAVLGVTRLDVQYCGNSLDDLGTSVEPAVERIKAGQHTRLPKTWQDGSLDFEQVGIARLDPFFVYLEPPRPGVIQPGDSGTALLVDGTPVGILLDADTERPIGRALRMDVAVWMLERVFRGAPASVPTAAASSGSQAAPLEGGSIAEVTARTHDDSPAPVDVLLSPDRSQGPWVGVAERFPVDIVVDLPGDQLHPVHAVTLTAPADAAGDRLPRDVQLAYSTGRRPGGFVVLRQGLFSPQQRAVVFDGLAIRARYLRLRILAGWAQGRPVLALQSIRVDGR